MPVVSSSGAARSTSVNSRNEMVRRVIPEWDDAAHTQDHRDEHSLGRHRHRQVNFSLVALDVHGKVVVAEEVLPQTTAGLHHEMNRGRHVP